MAVTGLSSGRTLLVGIILCSLTRYSEANGQWVYLSRYKETPSPSSSSSDTDAPQDFCVTGVQSFRVNVTSSSASSSSAAPQYRVIRFRPSEQLLAERPMNRKSFSDVFVSRDLRFGCLKTNSPKYDDGVNGELSTDIRGKTVVQVLKVGGGCVRALVSTKSLVRTSRLWILAA